MDELEDRLRGLRVAEPPLGFDPDEVATAAAKEVRNRRAVAATGTGTLAVIVAAVMVLAPDGGSGLSPAGTTSASMLPPQVRPHADSPRVDLTAQKIRNREHLERALGSVLPGATEFQVGEFQQTYGEREWDLMTSSVTYRDAAGVKRGFNLTISGVVSTRTGYASDSPCRAGQPAGQPAKEAKGPGGKPLRCEVLPRAGGVTVVIKEGGPAKLDERSPDGTGFSVERVDSRNAIAFSPDGTAVAVTDVGAQPETPGGAIPEVGPSLTDGQLLALVLDPGFTLR